MIRKKNLEHSGTELRDRAYVGARADASRSGNRSSARAGALARIDEAMAAPAGGEQPARRVAHRQRVVAARQAEAGEVGVAAPAVEGDRTRERIDERRRAAVLAMTPP